LTAIVDPAASTPFSYAVEPDGHRAVLRLRGEFDLVAVPDVEQVVAELAGVFEQLVVDLRDLTFMDSSGLRALIAADRSLQESGGQLVLIRGGKPIERLFELTQAGSLFTFEAGQARR